ncbi:hypothetical protein SAMN05660242_2864 [Thermoanaerobacterium sp. RBIITD]|nr:hypothetical protein SAMN05660242_2864 [Thermoanaerobacterium sp. RBIITD]
MPVLGFIWNEDKFIKAYLNDENMPYALKTESLLEISIYL